MALAYLSLKKNTGVQGLKWRVRKRLRWSRKNNAQLGGGQNSATRRLTQQSNCPHASTGMALVDLTIKKNAGGPRIEEWDWEGSCRSANNKTHQKVGQNSATRRTHETIKWTPGIYLHVSRGSSVQIGAPMCRGCCNDGRSVDCVVVKTSAVRCSGTARRNRNLADSWDTLMGVTYGRVRWLQMINLDWSEGDRRGGMREQYKFSWWYRYDLVALRCAISTICCSVRSASYI